MQAEPVIEAPTAWGEVLEGPPGGGVEGRHVVPGSTTARGRSFRSSALVRSLGGWGQLRRLPLVCLVASLLVVGLTGCRRRVGPPPDAGGAFDSGSRADAGAGRDSAAPDSGSARDSGVTVPRDTGVAVCPTGRHRCRGVCVSDRDPAHCGRSCSPCSASARTVAICDGVACGQECAPSYLRCGASCCAGAGLAVGGQHTCALTEAGAVKCWGHNSYGQLGDGTLERRLSPVDVVGLGASVLHLSTGGSGHTCAILSDRSVWCWGYNDRGQLGDATLEDRSVAVAVRGLPAGAEPISVSTGARHSCVALADGRVYCWGAGGSGRLGNGSSSDSLTAVRAQGVDDAASVSLGGHHSCALTTSGGVKCWGFNANGELGDGTTSWRNTAVQVSGLTSGVTALSAGSFHTCAIASGVVNCWGRNSSRELGDGTTMRRTVPTRVVDLSAGAIGVAAGEHHTCAIDAAGGVWCWGFSDRRLGAGPGASGESPQAVMGLTAPATLIEVANVHSCAQLDTGGVWCWGLNTLGQLGDGTVSSRSTAVPVVSP